MLQAIANLLSIASDFGKILFKIQTSSLLQIHFYRLVKERCNSIANALELRLSCTNLSIWKCHLLMSAILFMFHGGHLINLLSMYSN